MVNSMNKKPVDKKTLILGVVLIAVIIVLRLTGLTTFGSCIRIGYLEKKGLYEWSARYTLLSGSIHRRVNAGEGNHTILIEVNTKSGNIGLEISATDGTVFYSENDIPTSSFKVPVKGEVLISVIAQKHRGGFAIKWNDNYIN